MNASKGNGIVCKICSDDAIGRYFGTYLCGSCKAFFRRNASKSERFICPFTDSCEINKMTRRHCRKCRLEKCFKAGMKKEWIHSEDKSNDTTHFDSSGFIKKEGETAPSASTSAVNVIQGTSSAHLQQGSSSDEGEEDTTNITVMLGNLLEESALHDLLKEEDVEPMETSCKQLTEEIETTRNVNFQCYRFGDSQWNSREDPCEFHQTHQEYLTSTTYITNCGNLVCIGAPYKSTLDDNHWHWKVHQRILGANFTPICFRSEFISRRVALNHLETEKIDELCSFSLALCKNDPFEFPNTLDVQGFFKVFEICLNKLIPSLNTIAAFSSLCLEDRMVLIKRAFADILFMRAAVLIDIQTETLQIPKTPITLQLDSLKQIASNHYQQFMEFIKSLKPNWRTDFKANMLILLIMLFNPDTPNVFYPDNIRLQQYNYIYLLRRYLEYRSCLVCIARTDFYDLMMKIGEFQETFRSHEVIHDIALANREAVGTLLAEILDLN